MLNTSATDTSPTNEESNPSLGSGDSIIIRRPTRTLSDRLNVVLGPTPCHVADQTCCLRWPPWSYDGVDPITESEASVW